MRHGPDFHADEHRVLEHALDVAGNIGGNDRDARRPHQRDDDVARPCRWIPDRDDSRGAVTRKTKTDQDETYDRDQREKAQIGSPAELGDQSLALAAPGDENVRAEKQHKPDDFDSKAHDRAPAPLLRFQAID